jgi:3-methyladenine DNA glycosylase AlkD
MVEREKNGLIDRKGEEAGRTVDGSEALDEVEAALTAAARGLDPRRVAERTAYMKSAMPILGLAVPAERALVKRGFTFSRLPFALQFPLWDHVWWHARSHEAKSLATFWVDAVKDAPPSAEFWRLVSPWSAGIVCWDMSDVLSGLHARLLEAAPEVVLPDLVRWNGDANPWLRRQSVVSLVFQGRMRRRVLPAATILDLVAPLLDDPDRYVQKGVGWCLRESSVVHGRETAAFLRRHAGEISSIAWAAAGEKLDAELRAEILALRHS